MGFVTFIRRGVVSLLLVGCSTWRPAFCLEGCPVVPERGSVYLWEVGFLVPSMERGTYSPIAPRMRFCSVLGSSTNPAGPSLEAVSAASAWGWGKHPVSLRKGRAHPGQGSQFCSTFLGDRKSLPLLLGSQPHPVGPIASAAGQGSIWFWQHRTGVPACSLPTTSCPSSALDSLLPAHCHCRLPPELSPLGVRDTVALGLPVTTFPSSASAPRRVTQPSSPSMPMSITGVVSPAPINPLGSGVLWILISERFS